MVTKYDKRYYETELKIVKSLDSLLQHRRITSITPSDVCKEGAISESTFYRHHKDLADCIEYYEHIILSDVIDSVNAHSNDSTELFVNSILLCLYKNRVYLKTIIDTHDNTLLFQVMNAAKDGLTKTWPTYSKKINDFYYQHLSLIVIGQVWTWKLEGFSPLFVSWRVMNIVFVANNTPRLFGLVPKK